MNVLIFHPSLPGQYLYLAQHLAKDPKNKVVFLAKESNHRHYRGVKVVLYKPTRGYNLKTHNYLIPSELAVLEGQAALRSLIELKAQGFVPDVMIGHTGWGTSMFFKDVYPKVPIIGYFEWYYNSVGSDSNYWETDIMTLNDKLRTRMRNIFHLANLVSCDLGYCPTEWQKRQFPEEFYPKLEVVHEGVDTKLCCPNPEAKMILPDIKLDLSGVKEIITYVSRGFEPYRGFPQFMDAIRIVLKNRPKCHVVIVGADKTFYGSPSPDGRTYKQIEVDKGGFDASRVHFVGRRSREDYAKILQAGTVHVYLTRPFILSWSLMESMAAGCCVISSATPPVEEMITDNVNGLLSDFRSPKHIASRIEEALDDRKLRERLSKAARESMVEKYALDKMLAKQIAMLESQLKG